MRMWLDPSRGKIGAWSGSLGLSMVAEPSLLSTQKLYESVGKNLLCIAH